MPVKVFNGKKFKFSKHGHIIEVRNSSGKLLKEVEVNGETYKRNSVWKTYNSVSGNELLHRRDLD